MIQKYVAAVGRELTPGTPRLYQGTHKSPTGPPVQITVAEVGEKLRAEVRLPDGSIVSQAIDSSDRRTWVVATAAARYWFDAESGLLLRRVVHSSSPVGRIPEETDFDDYRDVGGLKLPFVTRVALVDPWSGGTRQAETIRAPAEIAPSEFEKPSPSGASTK